MGKGKTGGSNIVYADSGGANFYVPLKGSWRNRRILTNTSTRSKGGIGDVTAGDLQSTE